jgi:hypothetical protein
MPYLSAKAESQQHPPQTPNFDEEALRDRRHEGHPPLAPHVSKTKPDLVVFYNVSSLWTRAEDKVVPMIEERGSDPATIAVRNGKIICTSRSNGCSSFLYKPEAHMVNLRGGSISPALVSSGSALGLAEIVTDSSTADGPLPDPVQSNPPSILGKHPVIRAADGFQAHTRDALLAWHSGVTKSITAPMMSGTRFLQGLSTVIDLGASVSQHPILQEIAALHVSISRDIAVSVSTQIASKLLRKSVGQRVANVGKRYVVF